MKLKCPTCVSEGKRSKLMSNGSYTTHGCHQLNCVFFDEEGTYHNHYDVEKTAWYICSNGHRHQVKLYEGYRKRRLHGFLSKHSHTSLDTIIHSCHLDFKTRFFDVIDCRTISLHGLHLNLL